MDLQKALRPGQIIQGKILKIYPNQKAEIQLGSQKLVAELEASLTIGKTYLFQVRGIKDVVHLQVIEEQGTADLLGSIASLLKQLGLKSTKANIALTEALLREKIPFTKEQLHKAFNLMDSRTNLHNAIKLLTKMIQKNYPITPSVIEALSASNSVSISVQMRALLNILQNEQKLADVGQQLIVQLDELLNAPMMDKRVATDGMMQQSYQLYTALKAVGVIGQDLDFSTWQSSLIKTVLPQSEPTETRSMENWPIQFKEIVANEKLLYKNAADLLHVWGEKLTMAIRKQTVLTEKEFDQLKQQISEHLRTLFPQQHANQLTVRNDRESLSELLNILKTFHDKDTYVFIRKLTSGLQHVHQPTAVTATLIQTLNRIGLSYEHDFMHQDREQPKNTVKGMLLQLVQNSSKIVQKHAQQLIHLINGLQLQSVQETNHFIQAHLQIPAQQLGLKRDIKLDFESKKTPDGKINSDYCRILFYLEMPNLGSTIIDMNVQKRSISITVYNNERQLKERSLAFKPILESGLESLNYRLSNIIFKQMEQTSDVLQRTFINNEYRSGVDFRI